eukprot:GEMP01074809.1.p1 GENE.GEMP01074809.1~~GEMP01074809.1.p1  ORF type:complete len:326 (+),score=56.35 GEMP01074809.1:84-980(+)
MWVYLSFFGLLAGILVDFRRKALFVLYSIAYAVCARDKKFISVGAASNLSPKGTKNIIFVVASHPPPTWHQFVFGLKDGLFVGNPLPFDPCLSSWAREAASGLRHTHAQIRSASMLNSVVCCAPSNQACSVALLAMEHTFTKNVNADNAPPPIWMMSSLSEISHAVSSICEARAHEVARKECSELTQSLDPTFHYGPKSPIETGDSRVTSFCHWVFSATSPCRNMPTVVAFVHPKWLNYFSQAFLPADVFHDLKRAQLPFGSVVALTLEEASGQYVIKSDSISTSINQDPMGRKVKVG